MRPPLCSEPSRPFQTAGPRCWWTLGLLALALALAMAAPSSAKSSAPALLTRGGETKPRVTQRDGANAATFPAQVRVRKRAAGDYYVNAQGMTLYALNQRIAFTRSGGANPYCVGPCASVWAETSAPADATPVGEWSIVAGASGPQWAYRRNPVFTYRADKAPGDTGGDAYEDLWDVIVHVPPAPALIAPPVVTTRLVGATFILVDKDNHALFVPVGKGPCALACAGWTPLLAGMAALDVGDWTVERGGDEARWTYRGKAVFVSPTDAPAVVPDGGRNLRP